MLRAPLWISRRHVALWYQHQDIPLTEKIPVYFVTKTIPNVKPVFKHGCFFVFFFQCIFRQVQRPNRPTASRSEFAAKFQSVSQSINQSINQPAQPTHQLNQRETQRERERDKTPSVPVPSFLTHRHSLICITTRFRTKHIKREREVIELLLLTAFDFLYRWRLGNVTLAHI